MTMLLSCPTMYDSLSQYSNIRMSFQLPKKYNNHKRNNTDSSLKTNVIICVPTSKNKQNARYKYHFQWMVQTMHILSHTSKHCTVHTLYGWLTALQDINLHSKISISCFARSQRTPQTTLAIVNSDGIKFHRKISLLQIPTYSETPTQTIHHDYL